MLGMNVKLTRNIYCVEMKTIEIFILNFFQNFSSSIVNQLSEVASVQLFLQYLRLFSFASISAMKLKS